MTALLIDIVVKCTVILAIAVGAAVMLRRAAAATRHLAWTAALLCTLALPALAWSPGWQLPRLAPWAQSFFAESTTDNGKVLATLATIEPVNKPDNIADVSQRPNPLAVAPGSDRPAATAPAALNTLENAPWWQSAGASWAILWLVGAVFSLLAIALGFRRLLVLGRRCTPITTGPIHDLAADGARHLGIRRRLTLLSSPDRAIPMTWGLLRPTLLLPEAASTWSNDRLRMVLLHELGHIARWDCLTHLLGVTARCVYWFHPLVWLAVAQQRREQEKACDDLVVGHGEPAQEYAEHLLAVTADLPAAYFAATPALGMARSSRLGDRLSALLDSSRRRGPAGRRTWISVSVLSLVLLATTATAKWAPPPPPPADDPVPAAVAQEQPMSPDVLKKIEEIRKKLREHYVGPLDDKQLTEAAIKGLLQGLRDPYTDYLPPEELNAVDAQIKGSFFGIGAQLKMVNDRLTIVTPLDNSPALKAGLRAGDMIEAIDGQATRGVELPQAVKRILGENGTVVKLKIVRDNGAVEDISVTRGPIRVATVQGFQRGPGGQWRYLLDGEHKVGYVRIVQFGAATSKELRAAIEAQQKDGMKGLILDLRFCPGGLLDQALAACKLFIKDGQLLTIKGAGKHESSYRADGKDTLDPFPMVVLVNDQTASAAELTAGVLRDHHRAIVLGSRTFGKGNIQQIVKLDDGGALRVTSAFYYLPSGRMIHKRPGEKSWGVDPDDGYYLPLTKAQTDALQKSQSDRFTLGLSKAEKTSARLTPKLIEEQYADPQTAAAARTLNAKLTGGEFIKVGQSTAKMEDHLLRLEELRRKRETLLQDLQRLEKDIDAAAKAK